MSNNIQKSYPLFRCTKHHLIRSMATFLFLLLKEFNMFPISISLHKKNESPVSGVQTRYSQSISVTCKHSSIT